MHDGVGLCEQSNVYLSSGLGKSVDFYFAVINPRADLRRWSGTASACFLWLGWYPVFHAGFGCSDFYDLSRRDRRELKCFKTEKGGNCK